MTSFNFYDSYFVYLLWHFVKCLGYPAMNVGDNNLAMAGKAMNV